MSYLSFGATIATSTVMMFGLMYLHTYALDHILYSQTWMWPALLMGAVIAIIMLLFMLGALARARPGIRRRFGRQEGAGAASHPRPARASPRGPDH